jgi:hypothetical protein
MRGVGVGHQVRQGAEGLGDRVEDLGVVVVGQEGALQRAAPRHQDPPVGKPRGRMIDARVRHGAHLAEGARDRVVDLGARQGGEQPHGALDPATGQQHAPIQEARRRVARARDDHAPGRGREAVGGRRVELGPVGERGARHRPARHQHLTARQQRSRVGVAARRERAQRAAQLRRDGQRGRADLPRAVARHRDRGGSRAVRPTAAAAAAGRHEGAQHQQRRRASEALVEVELHGAGRPLRRGPPF